MIRSITGLCMGLTFLTQFVFAQSTNTVRTKYISAKATRPLTVGDKVPDFLFPEMMNWSATSGRLSDFRAELTILDLWSTSCHACVSLFPHMQSLKSEFGDRLNIILVNSQTTLWQDSKQKIQNLLDRQKEHLGTIALPIALNAPQFDSAFPAQTLPEEIWLDRNGKILAITGAFEVTAPTIQAVLDGKNVRMHLKRDAMIRLENTTLQEWYYGQPDKEHASPFGSILVKGFIDGINGTGIRVDKINKGQRLLTGWYTSNKTPFSIIISAYNNIIKVPANQILFQNVDTTLLAKRVNFDTTVYSKLYSYDITVPPSRYDDLMKFIQQDISRCFQVNIDTGQAQLECLVVEKGPDFHPVQGDAHYWPDPHLQEFQVQGYTVHDVIRNLNQFAPIPLVDGSNGTDKMNLTLPVDLYDFGSVIKSLENAGLKVSHQKRVFNVVTIIGTATNID